MTAHDTILAVTLSLVLAMASTVGAQSVPPSGIVDDKIEPAVERHVARTFTFRHQIHQNLELGNREYGTAKLVEDHLWALGIKVRSGIAHTGLLGILRGDKDGSIIAVRADMDALPVTEDTDLAFKSTKRGTYNGQDVGIMHALAQSGAGGRPRSGWYVGVGGGANWASDIDQEGWNRETTCYPTDACFDADPIPEISGYRWLYDIDAASGAMFEISGGLIFDRTRMELSFAQRKDDLDQMFRSITEYDGTSLEDRRGGSVVSNARASIDHLTVRTLALNAYYDFPDAYRGISLYLGGGLGPAFVELSGLHFSTDYEDTSGNAPTYDPPLSFYNSRQDADLSDTVLGRASACRC